MSGLEIVRRDDALIMAEYGYRVFDDCVTWRKWHVVAHGARFVCASFDTRREARAYVRDMGPIFA